MDRERRKQIRLQNLLYERDGVYRVRPDSNVDSIIAEAIALSAEKGRVVEVEVNGVILQVSKDSEPEFIYNKYSKKLHRQQKNQK